MSRIIGFEDDGNGNQLPIFSRNNSKKNGRLVISIGSSLTSQGVTSTSAKYSYDAVGFCEWAAVLSNQRFNYRNSGSSGSNTTQMLARLYTDVLAYEPDAVIVQNGTNEIGDGVDSIWTNTKDMYDQILATGAHLLACSILPRGGGSGWTEEDQKTALELNEKKRKYCMLNANCTYIDLSEYITDPDSQDGYPLTGMLRDGTHYTPRGAFRAGTILSETLNQLFTPTDVLSQSYLDADGTDLVYGVESVNPTLLGTGGVAGTAASGTIPSGWRIERTSGSPASGTIAGAIIAPTGIDPAYKFEMTFTPGGSAGEEFYMRTQSATMTPNSTDDFYEALIGIEVDAWDHWEEICLEMDDQGTGNKTIHAMGNVQDELMPTEGWSGILRTPYFKSDGGMRLRLKVTTDGTGSGTGVIRVFKPQLRRVDPNFLPAIYDYYDNGTDNKVPNAT